MGIRKLLKTSLALLAVGGVSFAGSAFAGNNDIEINQHASGDKVVKNYDESGAYQVQGDSNIVNVKLQEADNGNAKVLFDVYGDSNEVGIHQKQKAGQNATFKFEIGSSSKAVKDNKVHIDTQTAGKNASIDINQASNSNIINITTSVAQNGDNSITIRQDGVDSNTVTISNQNASADQSTTITQTGSGSYHNDLTIATQSAGGSISNTISQTNDGSADNNVILLSTQTASTNLTNKIEQNGSGNNIQVDYQSAGSDINNLFTQDGNTNKIHLNQTASSGYIHDTVSMTGDTNTLDAQTTATTNIDMTVTVNGNDNLAFLKQDAKSGSVDTNITLSGNNNNIVGVNYDSKKGTLTYDTAARASQTGNNVTLDITAGSNNNVGISQDATGGDASFTAKLGDGNTVVVDQTSSNGDSSATITADNSNYALVYQDGVANTLNLNLTSNNHIVGSYVDSNGYAQAYADSANMPAVQEGGTNTLTVDVSSGTDNVIALHQEVSDSSGENYFNAQIAGSNNEIAIYQVGNTQAYADINVASDGNHLKIVQESAGGDTGNAIVMANIQ